MINSPLKKGCITFFRIPDQVGNDEKRNDLAFRHTREGGYPTEPSVFQQAVKDHARFAILLFLLSILPFLPTLKATYLNWDDDVYFTENPDIDSPQGWEHYLDRFARDANTYPMVFASFKLENALYGKTPTVSHAINLLLHGLVSVTAFFLLVRWVPDPKIAFWAALLFAIHPLQVSTVAWVAERKSLLGSFFFLLALIAGTPPRNRPGVRIWLTLPLAVCAYLCKSPLVVFPLVLLIAQWVSARTTTPNPERFGRAFWGVWFLHFLTALGFAWIYAHREVGQSLSVREKLELVPRVFWHHLSSWAFPIHLLPVYPKWNLGEGPLPLWEWLGLFLILVFVIGLRKRIDPLEWFGGLFAAITFFPASGLVSFGYQKHAYVSDHFMYLPVLGLAVILSSLMTRISLGRKFFFPILCSGLTFLWGLVSFQQCHVWRTPASFWGAVLRADDRSWIGHENLATYLDQEGEIEKAYEHYQRAVEINPEEPVGWINLGRNLIRQRRYQEAAHALARAIDLNVFYVEAHLFRAEAFLRMGEEQKAVDQFHSAIAVRSGNVEARLKIADLLLHAKNKEVQNPEQALRWLRPFEDAPFSPSTGFAWGLMAEAHARMGDFDQAIAIEKKHLEKVSSDPPSKEAVAVKRKIGFYQRGFVP